MSMKMIVIVTKNYNHSKTIAAIIMCYLLYCCRIFISLGDSTNNDPNRRTNVGLLTVNRHIFPLFLSQHDASDDDDDDDDDDYDDDDDDDVDNS